MSTGLMHPQLARLVARYADLDACLPDVQRAFEVLLTCFQGGGKLLLCGNGGSAADCEHIVGELMKGFYGRRPLDADLRARLQAEHGADGARLAASLQGALPAISLVSHPALQFAFANDVAPDLVFAQQVHGYGRPGDVLLAISTSGNSTNVMHAVQVASTNGLRTIALTGGTGGRLTGLCEVVIRAPGQGAAEIQERHLPIYHALCLALEEELFQEG